VLLNTLLGLLIPYWEELILNPQTGKPSAKNLFAAMSFVIGIGGAVASIVADIVEHRPVEKTAILLLLSNGSILAGLKVYNMQLNRRTADETGQPLAVPPPATETPVVMPQVVNPNVAPPVEEPVNPMA
jgi:hypothetical protein